MRFITLDRWRMVYPRGQDPQVGYENAIAAKAKTWATICKTISFS
jgi:hypothetical protein